MAELPEGIDVKEPTRQLLRRASLEFHEENPYVKMVDNGAIYLPPEAKVNHDPKPKGEGSDSDDDTQITMPTENAAGGSMCEPDVPQVLNAVDYSSEVVWHARIVADDFRSPKHTLPNGDLKPRRPIPHIKASDLIKGLQQQNGSYYFPAQLNQWPSMQNFMLVSITKATAGWGGLSTSIQRLWTAKEGKQGKALPAASELGKHCRATFWAPRWMKIGWSMPSAGFVFWYSEQHGAPRLLFGTEMVKALRKDDDRDASITNIHCYAHRYPTEKETLQDNITYHTMVLVEWEHQKFTSVFEVAFLNAIGGYGGKSNWVEDKLEPATRLFQTIGEQCPGMIQPWSETLSEVRITDHPARNIAEFEAYLHKYSNKAGIPVGEQRFVEPERYASGKLKLRSCNAETIADFMLNYIQRVWGYRQLQYNCQTFAADMFSFLTGDRNHTVYSTIMKAGYAQHFNSFLYAPTLGKEYTEKAGRKGKQGQEPPPAKLEEFLGGKA